LRRPAPGRCGGPVRAAMQAPMPAAPGGRRRGPRHLCRRDTRADLRDGPTPGARPLARRRIVRRKRPKLGDWLWLGWLISIPPTTALFRRTWRGIEHIPERGPAIIALNHVSHVDPLLAIRFVYEAGRIPRILAKSSLFSVFLFGRVLRRCKQIPV